MSGSKESLSSIKVDPKTGAVSMDADAFLKRVSAKEDAAAEGKDFNEIRELMEEGPAGEKSESPDSPPGFRDTREIKTETALDYDGRVFGGTPKGALQLGKRKAPSKRPPRRL